MFREIVRCSEPPVFLWCCSFSPIRALSQGTPGFWTGDYSVPHGCTWNVQTLDTTNAGHVYLSLQGHVCGQKSGTLFVYDPAEDDFEPVGDFSHDSNPTVGVLSIRADGSDVYVGGNFTHADGLRVNNLARWDGSQWHKVGADATTSGVDSPGNARVIGLALDGPDLLVAGNFSKAGGEVASHFGHFVRDLGGAQIEIDIEVEEIDSMPAGQSPSLLMRGSASSLLYTVDVLNVGSNRARDVEFSVSANPEPDSVEWTCAPVPGTNAVCPVSSGSGLPNLVFDLPQHSGLRFTIVTSIDGDELYTQELEASTSAAPVLPGDSTDSSSSSSTTVNDRLFRDRFE